MAGSANSIVARNVLRGTLNANNLMEGHVDTAFNPTYALVDEAGNQIALYINSSNYQFYAELKDKYGNHISNSNIIDLPLESMVVNGSYDAETKEVVLILDNGNEVRFSVADLVEGLVSTEQLTTILSDYVKFTNYASGSKSGVIKTSTTSGTTISDNGYLQASTRSYSDYLTDENALLVGKGTLENVITGKDLITKSYVDTADAVFEEDLFGNETVNDNGENITLNNTTDKAPMKIDLKGNTYQNGEPTPDTPIDIQVVSGDNEVKVEGKNLFDVNDYSSTADTKYEIVSNGEIKLTSLVSTWYSNYEQTIQLKPNTTYTLSATAKQDHSYITIGNASATDFSTNERKSVSYTTDSTGLTTFKFRKKYNNDIPYFIYEDIQLEEGQPTTYTPYISQTYPISLGNIELCKIGTYQDSIVKDNGKWYLNKQIGKHTFTGSEPYYKSDVYSTNEYFCGFSVATIYNPKIEGTGFINKFIIGNYVDTPTECMRISTQGHIKVLASRLSENTANGVKQWLATQYNNNNPVEIYYILATPTNTEITDSTLLGQLNNLYNANSYEGTTNVSQVNNDLPFELGATAFVDSTAGKLAAASAQINTLTETDNNLNNTKEDKSNKVVSISASSTDTEYPTAKCVYDIVGNVESLLEALDIGNGV